MPYTPYYDPWEDSPDETTPITAAALNHIEQGIADIDTVLQITFTAPGPPDDAFGEDGDYYLDNVAGNLYGPKTAGIWGSPVSLRGNTGPAGTGSASVVEAQLNGATSAGATSVVIDRAPSGMLAGGTWVAVAAMTTKCEVRRVTEIVSTTLTFETPLAYAHNDDDFVWVLNTPDVPLEWFGCQADEPTFDSFTGIQQALNDISLTGGGYGLTGHAKRYYIGTPIAVNDGTYLSRITLQVKAPLSIDPLVGERLGEPAQFLVTLAGQYGTIASVDTTTNVITLSDPAGATIGDRLVFYPIQGATLPAPLEAGRGYFMKTFPTSTSYTISVDRDGPEVDFTTTGSGTCVFYSTGAARMKWDNFVLEGNDTPGLNGCVAVLQQPSTAFNLRVEDFPGPQGLLVLNGQQGVFYDTLLNGGAIGLNCQSMQFLYMHGSSFEDCDILVHLDANNLTGTLAGSRDVRLCSSHYEASGGHTRMIQAILGNSSVSAGTFTVSFGGQTTAGIAYNASAATIQTALEALSTIDPGDVTCVDYNGGLAAGSAGYCQLEFGGQYAYSALSGTYTITVTSSGLTGGSYSRTYYSPTGGAVIVSGAPAGLNIDGGVLSAGGIRPDGTSMGDLMIIRSGVATNGSYTIKEVVSLGQGGYAINDIPNGFQIPWADSSGASERMQYYSYGGYHGASTTGESWILAAVGGKNIIWDAVKGEFQVNDSATVRFGTSGPIVLSGSGSPEAAVTAPVGSLYLRTNGGAGTSMYVKESGSGNTGWVGK